MNIVYMFKYKRHLNFKKYLTQIINILLLNAINILVLSYINCKFWNTICSLIKRLKTNVLRILIIYIYITFIIQEYYAYYIYVWI